MTASQPLSPIRAAARAAGLTLLCLAAAAAALIAWSLAVRLWTGQPLDASLFNVNPIESDYHLFLLLLAGGFAAELLFNGWKSHPLCRALTAPGATDLFYVIAAVTGLGRVLALVLTFGLAAAIEPLAGASPKPIAGAIPLLLAVPLAYIAAEFGEYMGHRLLHTKWLWPVHAVHHAAEDMTLLTTFRRHPIDNVLLDIFTTLPAALLGLSPEAVLIAGYFSSTLAVLSHSRVPFPAFLEPIFTGPRAHRLHHAASPEFHDTNFCGLALIDRMFGTYRAPDGRDVATGIPGPRPVFRTPVHEMIGAAKTCVDQALAALRPRRAVPLTLATATLAALLATPATAAEPVSVVRLAAEGTQFAVTLNDGRVLRSPELAGMALLIATPDGPKKIRVAAVERDPDAVSDGVWLHTLLLEHPNGTTEPYCGAGPDGRRQAFPLNTRVLPDGRIESTPPEQFDIVCTAGSLGKCVRFGYRPWHANERALYDACNRMVRADYCGAGEGTTNTGMPIDVYDDRGFQRHENNPAEELEAGWGPNGAVCVRHTRVKENIALPRLEAACPRLAGRTGAMCTEENARSWGAILFNRSRP